MQEKNRNHRPQGAGQPPHHMIYIYMVDTPKESDGNKATEDNPLEKQSKHRRHRRRFKPGHRKISDTGTRDNNVLDSAEDDDNPLQPDLEREEEQASLRNRQQT